MLRGSLLIHGTLLSILQWSGACCQIQEDFKAEKIGFFRTRFKLNGKISENLAVEPVKLS
jgi:hypothetical protein